MRLRRLIGALVGAAVACVLATTATAATTVVRSPIAFSAGTLCLGEEATFTGTVTNITAGDGTVSTLSAQGIGSTTGTKFIATGGTHFTILRPSSGAVILTANIRLRFISASGGENYFHTTTIHYTFTPDGRFVASVENFQSCTD
jgi:hypothetical protein